MLMRMLCPECGKSYDIAEDTNDKSKNYIYLCSNCFEHVYSVCDYGTSPIAPCDILLDGEIIAEIQQEERNDGREDTYWLISEKLELNQPLKGGYENLGCYKEASAIAKDILRKEKEEK